MRRVGMKKKKKKKQEGMKGKLEGKKRERKDIKSIVSVPVSNHATHPGE